MIVYACAEVTPGSKLNLALSFSNGTPLLESLYSTATALFQRARHELCAAEVDGPVPSTTARRVAACTFVIDEAVIYCPETCVWSLLTSEAQLSSACQLYLFQPSDVVADVGIQDKVGQMPDPVKPHLFFAEFIASPSPPRFGSFEKALSPNVEVANTAAVRGHRLDLEDAGAPPLPSSPRPAMVPIPRSRSSERTIPVVRSAPLQQAESSANFTMVKSEQFNSMASTSPQRNRRPSPPRTSSSASMVRPVNAPIVAAPSQLPENVTKELFHLLDEDKDGTVTLFQLHDTMKRLGVDTSPKSVGKTFAYGDRAVTEAVFANFVHRYWSLCVELLERCRSERATQVASVRQSPPGAMKRSGSAAAAMKRSGSTVSSPPQQPQGGSVAEQQESWKAQLYDVVQQEKELLAKLQSVRKIKAVLLNALGEAADNTTASPLAQQ